VVLSETSGPRSLQSLQQSEETQRELLRSKPFGVTDGMLGVKRRIESNAAAAAWGSALTMLQRAEQDGSLAAKARDILKSFTECAGGEVRYTEQKRVRPSGRLWVSKVVLFLPDQALRTAEGSAGGRKAARRAAAITLMRSIQLPQM
jgi:hypothetical protein